MVAADVVEVDIDALRCALEDLPFEVAVVVVEGVVEAEVLLEVADLLGAACAADSGAALDHGDLTHSAPYRACGAGDEHGFAFLERTDVQKPHVGCHAGHSQDAEIGGSRCLEFSESTQSRRLGDERLAPAEMRLDVVAFGEIRVVGVRHPADGSGR